MKIVIKMNIGSALNSSIFMAPYIYHKGFKGSGPIVVDFVLPSITQRSA